MKANFLMMVDCITGLKRLPDESVQTCVTSPPYWKLRNYGVAGQVGMEATPELYVSALVEVFHEVYRVLKKDGTLWLNLGDSYWSSGKRSKSASGIKNKDLVGIPWMVALALRDQGWYLRQDIIWHKPNAIPESVQDRCTKAHEYIFLLTKNPKYFYDSDSIKTLAGEIKEGSIIKPRKKGAADPLINLIRKQKANTYYKANRRSVWKIANRPSKNAHLAAFPVEIPELCIKAGSRPDDVVLDPFAGTGTAAVAAVRLGRSYIGFDLKAEYIRIAQNRIDAEKAKINPQLKLGLKSGISAGK